MHNKVKSYILLFLVVFFVIIIGVFIVDTFFTCVPHEKPHREVFLKGFIIPMVLSILSGLFFCAYKEIRTFSIGDEIYLKKSEEWERKDNTYRVLMVGKRKYLVERISNKEVKEIKIEDQVFYRRTFKNASKDKKILLERKKVEKDLFSKTRSIEKIY